MKEVQSRLIEQFHPTEQILKEILDCLMHKEQLLLSLIKHHHITFVNLYVKCGSGKDKYITRLAQTLLPKESSVDYIFPSESKCPSVNIEEIKDIQHSWSFCDTFPIEQQVNCKKFMILFLSAIYNILL